MRSGGQPQSRAQLSEIGLNLGGFAVALDLLGMGLADIDDGPAFQMAGGDFGGSVARPAFQQVVIVHLRSAGSGVADVLEQQRGQLDQQVGLELGRQLVPARNRLEERSARPGRGGLRCRFHRMTLVIFLHGCETLLAPACQLQEDLGRYYRMR